MGKITPNKHAIHPTTTTRTKKTEVPAPLKKLREATNKFVVSGRGHGLMGAGKPATFSNTPPKKGSKRVEESVAGTLTSVKSAKRVSK